MTRLLSLLILTLLVVAIVAPWRDEPCPSAGASGFFSDDPKLDALMMAIESKDEDSFRRLMRDGSIDLNAHDRKDNAALIRATQTGWVLAVRMLLEHGANANVTETMRLTALDYAPCVSPPASGEIADLLIEHSADVNHRGFKGVTPLMQAAMAGRADLVQRLLRAGADVNAAADNGFTPLHDAAVADHPQVVQLLLAAGASPE